MLLTLYYMTSTCIQSWRLNSLRNTFVQWFNRNSSIVLYKEKSLSDLEPHEKMTYESLGLHLRGVTSEYCVNKASAHLLDLWCYKLGKRGCSVVPSQDINISSWIGISKNDVYFPVKLQHDGAVLLSQSKLSLLIEASFNCRNTTLSNFVIQLEKYGEPKAWTANEYFAIILETDLDHLTKLSCDFMFNELYLNDVMEIIRLETVSVFGNPCELLHADRIPILIYSLKENGQKEVLGNNVESKTFHVEMLRTVARSAEKLQQSQDNSYDLEYPEVEDIGYASLILFSGFLWGTAAKIVPLHFATCIEYFLKKKLILLLKFYFQLFTRPVALVKSNFFKIEEKTSNYEVFSSPNNISSNSKHEESLSVNEDVLESLFIPSIPRGCSLSTVSNSCSNPVIMDSLMNSLDELDWKKSSRASLLTAETASLNDDTSRFTVTSVRHRGEQKTGKPPNILVFSESPSMVENIKTSLNSVLRKHRYTVYSLTLNEMLQSPWTQQAVLVVLCGNVPLSLKPLLLKYLLNYGGQLLCLCSDLLGVVLPTFKTAEVRPDETVTFSYEKWSRISLLHHIFCYQPSPKSSKFSLDESPSNTTVSSNVPSTVELIDPFSQSHILEVKVLASEETWQTPTLLLASKTDDYGKVLFSQVHLEVDPKTAPNTSYDPKMRLSLLSDLLSRYLGLECDTSDSVIKFTPSYFLGRHELKLEFIKKLSSYLNKDNTLQMKRITLKFLGKGSSLLEASDSFLPVMLYDCPSNFSTLEYFNNLKTEHLGRLVIYSEVMTSSMDVLNGPVLEHGFVAISRQQTNGVGRGGNAWISPDGCAMFSLQLHIPLMSPLGKRLSLLQHIIALSIVSAIRSLSGYENLSLGLKWPNDIYAGGMAKIGGLIITSSIVNDVAVCNAGCALNLSNSLPTTCVNDMITEINEETDQKLPKLSLEKYFACVFTQLESLLNTAQNGEIDVVFDLYYKYWLHNLAEVKIAKDGNFCQTATIIGVDDFGFLKVRGENGDVFTVQPDGNTFDMLSGLIAPK